MKLVLGFKIKTFQNSKGEKLNKITLEIEVNEEKKYRYQSLLTMTLTVNLSSTSTRMFYAYWET